MPRTMICLARHGETNWNLERRFQGQLDIPLNVRGRAQAEALTRELSGQSFDKIYSSDLKRAFATAQGPAQERGLAVETTPALREKHDGDWQCLTHAEVEALYPEDYQRYKSRRADFAIPGGETLERFAARARSTLTRIAKAHPGERVLIVSHAGVLDVAYRLATNKRLDESREQPVLNAAPNWIAYEDGAWSLVAWADESARPAIETPYDGAPLPRREAARALLIDPQRRALLLKLSTRLSPYLAQLGFDHFWAAPGGALEPSETAPEAARRETLEETGFDPGPLSERYASRTTPMSLAGGWVECVEDFFLLRVDPAPEIRLSAGEPDILDYRWWSADEIEASTDAIFPEGLFAELRRLD